MRFNYLYFLLYFFACLNVSAQNLIETISVEKQKISIIPHASFKQDYLTNDFFVMYEDDQIDLTKLSPSITTIPFILSVITMVWNSGKKWSIPIMDEDLFHSLEKYKRILILFYPQEKWAGELIPEHLEKNLPFTNNQNRCAVLFSGGVDATCTSFSHMDKKQLLITIGGNDVPLTKPTMWNKVKQQAQEYAQLYNHSNAFIISNFFTFLKKDNRKFTERMRRFWWALTLMGPSYIGLTAPLLYWHKHTDLYIASSYTLKNPSPYGTHPLIDNNISFFGLTVHHDGTEFNRQNKIKQIKKVSDDLKIPLPKLRVCWGKEKNGRNCCKCEKCLRTINNIIAEKNLPEEYGFAISLPEAFETTKKFINSKPVFRGGHVKEWKTIQARIKNQLDTTNDLSDELSNYYRWLSSLEMHIFCKDFKQLTTKQREEYEKLWNIGMQGSTDLQLLISLNP